MNPEIKSLFPRIRAIDTYQLYVEIDQGRNLTLGGKNNLLIWDL